VFVSLVPTPGNPTALFKKALNGSAVQQWEYKIESNLMGTAEEHFTDDLLAKLDQASAEGWELVAILPRDGGGTNINVFMLYKRSKTT
jgi:hypothetical protein